MLCKKSSKVAADRGIYREGESGIDRMMVKTTYHMGNQN